MKISLIIPVKNENPILLDKILKTSMKILKKYSYEIIVVVKNDAEPPNIIKHKKIKKIVQKGNGKGDAINLGIRHSKGNIVVFMDGDGSHIPYDIPKLIKPILNDEADLVTASRILGGSEELHGNFSQFFRLMATSLISLIVWYRFGVNLSDTQNGFRAIKKRVVESLDLKARNFDIETEMVIKCAKRGFRIKEIPSRELKRVFGKTRINLYKQWYWYVWRILVNLF